jgi:hypothetical protein
VEQTSYTTEAVTWVNGTRKTFEEIGGRVTPEQVIGSRDSAIVRLFDDDDDDDDDGDDGGDNVYTTFTNKCSSNVSLIAPLFSAERMTNMSATAYSWESAYTS